MIELKKSFSPICLNPTEVARLTAVFKSTSQPVWNIPELKEFLLATSFNKCAYCESNLIHESNYMEVEHFRDKKRHPDLVVNWDNLLPSCKRCNASKGNHDVVNQPIINPYLTNPKLHLKFDIYRLRGKSQLGRDTIDVLDLNNHERVCVKRFEVGEKILSAVDDAIVLLDLFVENGSTKTKNRLLGLVRGILDECQSSSSYSATASSVLHLNQDYVHLVGRLKVNNLWDLELQNLHEHSKNIALA